MSWEEINALSDEEVIERVIQVGAPPLPNTAALFTEDLIKMLELPEFAVEEIKKGSGPMKELTAKLPHMMKDNLRTLFRAKFTIDEMRQLIFVYETYGELLDRRSQAMTEHGMALIGLVFQAIANDPHKFLG